MSSTVLTSTSSLNVTDLPAFSENKSEIWYYFEKENIHTF